MASDALLRSRLRAAVDARMKTAVKPDGPGALVAVARNGRLLFLKGYGLANVGRRIPWTARTVHNIGSVSKQFTAFCILLLEREGRLKLTDDVREYVPELPRYGAPIRIDHLLHHTSGIRTFDQLYAIAGMAPLNDDRSQVLAWTAAQRELQEPTGTAWRYCNTGYVLLALIVERVTGIPYPEFAARRIFRPLGMTHTFVRSRAGSDVPGQAIGYSPRSDGRFVVHPHGGMGGHGSMGAGEIFTTAPDLLRWSDNYRLGRIGGPAILRAMRRPGRLRNGKVAPVQPGRKIAYGGGLCLATLQKHRIVWHAGGLPGYISLFIRVQTPDFTIVMFSNNDAFDLGAVQNCILPVMAPPPAPAKPPAFTPAHPVEPKPDPDIMVFRHAALRAYEGVYRPVKEKDKRWAVQAIGDRLRVTAPWGRMTWAPIRRHGFIGQEGAPDSEFYFTMSPAGRPTGIVEYKHGVLFKEAVAVVLPRQVPPARLRTLAGPYDSAEVRTRFGIQPGRWWLTAIGPRAEPELKRLPEFTKEHPSGRPRIAYFPADARGARWFTERSTMTFTRRRGRVTRLTWTNPRVGYGIARLKLARPG